MKTLFCHVSHEKRSGNFKQNKLFHDELLNNAPKTITTNIITNIPMLLCFLNGGGHCDVMSPCTSPISQLGSQCHQSVVFLALRRAGVIKCGLWKPFETVTVIRGYTNKIDVRFLQLSGQSGQWTSLSVTFTHTHTLKSRIPCTKYWIYTVYIYKIRCPRETNERPHPTSVSDVHPCV